MNKNLQLLEKLINKNGLSQSKNEILKIIKPEVILSLVDEDNYENIGNTRFGGYPDLPLNFDYPYIINNNSKYYLNFLCQINLSDLKEFDLSLPKSGIIYFFISNKSINYQFHSCIEYKNSKIIYINNNELLKPYHIEYDQVLPDYNHLMNQAYTLSSNIMYSLPYKDEIKNYINNIDLVNYENLYKEWYSQDFLLEKTLTFYFNNEYGYDVDNIYIGEALENIPNTKSRLLCSFSYNTTLELNFNERDLIVITSDINTYDYNYIFTSP